ncbi:MAG: hypothetical protein DMG32_23855 [Acidobacteria bacterium]|nr:MAG: hypothetical protein DMG32_23855 [Acidobacteriota bacterium]
MRGNRFVRAARFILFAIVAALVLSFVFMQLWNWLMPAVFGLHLISFWQALGLLVLGRLLLGGFLGPWRRGMHWRGRMMERWAQMTPEEREKFRAGMQGGRCRPYAPPSAPEAKA